MKTFFSDLPVALFRLLGKLPLGFLFFISSVLMYPLVYYVARYRLKVVRRNMEAAFPEKSIEQRRRMERAFYHHFCDMFMEMLHIFGLDKEEALTRMHFVNPELVTDYADKQQGVLLTCGHYGNWEYMSLLFLKMLDTGNQQGYSVYKPLRCVIFDRLFQQIRSRFGGGIVTKDGTFRQVIRLRKAGIAGIFGLVSDQSPTARNLHYWTRFLNQDTAFLTGPERMAKQTGFAVLYADVKRMKRGYYETTFRRITDEPMQTPEFWITERFARLMEETILRDPAYWLWTHKRWKHKRSMESFKLNES